MSIVFFVLPLTRSFILSIIVCFCIFNIFVAFIFFFIVFVNILLSAVNILWEYLFVEVLFLKILVVPFNDSFTPNWKNILTYVYSTYQCSLKWFSMDSFFPSCFLSCVFILFRNMLKRNVSVLKWIFLDIWNWFMLVFMTINKTDVSNIDLFLLLFLC